MVRRDEHLVGESEFFDALRQTTFRNGLEIDVRHDRAIVHIRGTDAPDGRIRVTHDRGMIRMLRAMIQDMRREAWRSRRVTSLWKHRTELPEQVCPRCEGARWIEDKTTGEEWPCSVCNDG